MRFGVQPGGWVHAVECWVSTAVVLAAVAEGVAAAPLAAVATAVLLN